MGSVQNIVTIEDEKNPEKLAQYEMHYLYCDNCGSFELENWIEPENHLQLEKYQRQLSIAIFVASFGILVGGIWLVAGGSSWVLFFSFLILLVIVSIQRYLSAKVNTKGVQCGNCDVKYELDSNFFRNFTENPHNLSMEDIRMPLHFTYKMKGKYIGPEKE